MNLKPKEAQYHDLVKGSIQIYSILNDLFVLPGQLVFICTNEEEAFYESLGMAPEIIGALNVTLQDAHQTLENPTAGNINQQDIQ